MQEYNNDLVLHLSRESKIPSTAVKITPADDQYPPFSPIHLFFTPVPLSGPVNTAGAEDSLVITSDGAALYFFFIPDVSIPTEKQVLDGVTGIYVSCRKNGSWMEPERVILQDNGRLASDDAPALMRTHSSSTQNEKDTSVSSGF